METSNKQQHLLTLALFVPTDQSVIFSFRDDVDSFSCFDRQLLAGPLFVGQRGDDGHLVQHLDLPFILRKSDHVMSMNTLFPSPQR